MFDNVLYNLWEPRLLFYFIDLEMSVYHRELINIETLTLKDKEIGVLRLINCKCITSINIKYTNSHHCLFCESHEPIFYMKGMIWPSQN